MLVLGAILHVGIRIKLLILYGIQNMIVSVKNMDTVRICCKNMVSSFDAL